jgi:hypothetical protein
MTTDEFFILCERNITLNDTSSLHCCGFVRLKGVFRELQACTAMANAKIIDLVVLDVGSAMFCGYRLIGKEKQQGCQR